MLFIEMRISIINQISSSIKSFLELLSMPESVALPSLPPLPTKLNLDFAGAGHHKMTST